jgi:hypothetical protein
MLNPNPAGEGPGPRRRDLFLIRAVLLPRYFKSNIAIESRIGR